MRFMITDMTIKTNHKDGDILSVLTLNLRFGLADDGVNGWNHRKRAFPVFFKEHCFDFISLQEANDFQIDFLTEILPEYNFIGKRCPAPFFWQDNIIFYKKNWQCVHFERFFLSPTPEIPSRYRKSRWARQCTLGVFKNNDHTLICLNTHFDFDTSVQVESAKIIMERLSHLPSNIPAILVGDFNASPSCPCHMIFTGVSKDRKIKGPYLKNVFQKPYPGTHHGFKGTTNGDHIDWILYRGKITPKDCQVIHDTTKGIYLSDHFPLCATFRWD